MTEVPVNALADDGHGCLDSLGKYQSLEVEAVLQRWYRAGDEHHLPNVFDSD